MLKAYLIVISVLSSIMTLGSVLAVTVVALVKRQHDNVSYKNLVSQIPSSEYIYTAASGNVWQFRINEHAVMKPPLPVGAPESLSPPTSRAGVGAFAVTFDPTSHFAYVSNQNSISQYHITALGQLRPLNPPLIPTGQVPSILFDHTGHYAYVWNNGGGIFEYHIAADGSLLPLHPATVATGPSPLVMQFTPDGRFAFVADGNGSIYQYKRAVDGSLVSQSIGVFKPGVEGPALMFIEPYGRFAYVVSYKHNAIIPCRIKADGTLVPLSLQPVPTGQTPFALAFSPNDKVLYVCNNDGNSIMQYRIGQTGLLLLLASKTLPSGASPLNITVHAHAHTVYVVNSDSSTVSQFHINADDTLSPLSPPSVPTGVKPQSLIISPSGEFAYVVNNQGNSMFGDSSTISAYKVTGDGTLLFLSSTSVGNDALYATAIARPAYRHVVRHRTFSLCSIAKKYH